MMNKREVNYIMCQMVMPRGKNKMGEGEIKGW